jgi:hypothetical protein
MVLLFPGHSQAGQRRVAALFPVGKATKTPERKKSRPLLRPGLLL